jgi:phosphoglycerate dehydrogenase-like enzyme
MAQPDTYHILTSARHGEAFEQYVRQHHPELKCTYAQSEEEAFSILPEVNALAGFNFLHKTDLSHLKWVHSFGAGIDAFLRHNFSQDLLFTKTEGEMGKRMAEYSLTHVLTSLQKINYFQQLQHKREWIQTETDALFERDIYILGTGNIGSAIAKIFKPLANKVVGINTRANLINGFSACITIEQLKRLKLDQAIFINTLPLTAATKDLIDASIFNNKKDLIFINVGRGATLNEVDLLHAIEKEQVKKAILDVFRKEPLPEDSKLWNNKAITITPHISGLTSFEDVISSFEQVYAAIKKGTEVPYQVDIKRQY